MDQQTREYLKRVIDYVCGQYRKDPTNIGVLSACSSAAEVLRWINEREADDASWRLEKQKETDERDAANLFLSAEKEAAGLTDRLFQEYLSKTDDELAELTLASAASDPAW